MPSRAAHSTLAHDSTRHELIWLRPAVALQSSPLQPHDATVEPHHWPFTMKYPPPHARRQPHAHQTSQLSRSPVSSKLLRVQNPASGNASRTCLTDSDPRH